ncbi:MAG: hypothetical protein U1D30_19395 [Planctomycetota bacterium]
MYITGVTYFRRDSEESSKRGLAAGAFRHGVRIGNHAICFLLHGIGTPHAWLAGLCFCFFLGWKVIFAIEQPLPAVQGAVKSAVLGLIALDAILVLAFNSPEHAATALLLPALFLGRWILLHLSKRTTNRRGRPSPLCDTQPRTMEKVRRETRCHGLLRQQAFPVHQRPF